MNDQEIVSSLIAHDSQKTKKFFLEDCRPLFISIINKIFDKQYVDYDETINDLYVHLMEDDAKRLRQFRFEKSIFCWLQTTAQRHFREMKIKNRVIENKSQEPLYYDSKNTPTTESSQAKIDLDALLRQMKNQRYASVIRMLMIEELPVEDVAQRLAVRVENIYNIKSRAMKALLKVALKDKRFYE